MGRDLKSILDECLRALAAGESLETILARYPHQADELRPLLLTVRCMRQVPVARPRSHVQQAGWQRFLGEAIALRRARQRQPAFAVWRPLAAAASLVLVLFLAGGATVYAASRSLPDSPLYPVKLAAEEARLWFVFDEDDRASILLDQAETRMGEIRKLVEQGKPVEGNVLSAMRGRMTRATNIINKREAPPQLVARASDLSQHQEQILLAIYDRVPADDSDEYGRVLAITYWVRIELRDVSEPTVHLEGQELAEGVGRFVGIVHERQDDAWIIGGVRVGVDEGTVVEGDGDAVAGRLAQVTVLRDNGGYRALSIALHGGEELTKTATISGIIDRIEGNTIQIGNRSVVLDPHALRDGKLQPGSRVEVSGRAQEGGAFVANLIHVAPAEEQIGFAYEGTVEEVEAGRLQVGGLTFELSPSTSLDAGAASLQPGVCARIAAVREGSRLVANRVTLVGREAPPEMVTVEGVFQGQINGGWLIGGTAVDLAAEGPALAIPPVGTAVKLVGTRKGEAIVVALAEAVRPPEEAGLLKLEGVVTPLADQQWQVGPAPIRVTAASRISGQLTPGVRAVVWALPSEEDLLDALYIDVLDAQSLLAPAQPY